jgi:hypothetical protein
MPDSELSDIGLSCLLSDLSDIGLKAFSPTNFFSDIRQGNIDVGYRISATKIVDVAPTYD